jgi:pimeloyl-ACP methyl ester carboxylesterase
VLTGSIAGADYRAEIPATWNGTLFLYSHGYVAPSRSNPATDSPSSQVSDWLLGHGYAIAGSSYRSTGWALSDAFKDQIALLDVFEQKVSKPKRVIAIGASLGGIITAGLVQLFPNRFAGGLALCGVLAGGVANWNTGLDAAYAFKTLLAPASKVQLVHITDPQVNLTLAMSIFGGANATAAGRARLALVAAVSDLPGWFDPTSPEPASTDFVMQAANQAQWESRIDFPFEFAFRRELEDRAGGNPSWNTGVDYGRQLIFSPYAVEVAALYRSAGLNLDADLRKLNGGRRIAADARAVGYLRRNINFNGRLTVPMLTVHTTGDGLVIPQNETAYGAVVKAAGKQAMLRQLFVHRAGHCAFTSAETIAAIVMLINRLDLGQWDDTELAPAALNTRTAALGAQYNNVGGFFLAAPSFVAYNPGSYPRAG